MFDGVGDYMDYINKLSKGEDNTSDHVEADCNDIYRQAEKSLNEIYNQASKNFTKYYGSVFPHVPNTAIGIGYPFIGYPYAQMSVQMMDITNKRAFIILGIFEYDSVPHDMKLLIFAENEEKVRELIDKTFSTDTSFFMIKNIKEA